MQLSGLIIQISLFVALTNALHLHLISEIPAFFTRTTRASISNTTSTNTTLATDQALRILPIGDSITWGYASSDGNGYRQHLLDLLPNNPTTYIGSQHSGNMTNDNSEGYPSRVITEIATNVSNSGTLKQLPNLVLIMAGTNDVNLNLTVNTAPQRLAKLIDEVQDACPDAVIIVAELIPIWYAPSEMRVQAFNDAIPGLIADRHNVLSVNMSSFVTTDVLTDGLHPTDWGYELMARGWFSGIQEAAAKQMVKAVVELNTTTPANTTGTATSSSTAVPTSTKTSDGTRMGMALCWGLIFMTAGWPFILIGILGF